jgi:hypothetical protein
MNAFVSAALAALAAVIVTTNLQEKQAKKD